MVKLKEFGADIRNIAIQHHKNGKSCQEIVKYLAGHSAYSRKAGIYR